MSDDGNSKEFDVNNKNEMQDEGVKTERNFNDNPPNSNNSTKQASSKKRVLIISSVSLFLIIGAVTAFFIFKHIKYQELAQQYSDEYEALLKSVNTFKKQVDAVPQEDHDLNALLSYYQDLNEQNTFASQLEELNENKVYADLTSEKKAFDSFRLDKTYETLDKINENLTKIKGILQRSVHIDTEITVFETSVWTLGEAIKKMDALFDKNDALKEDLLSIVVDNKLAKAQSLLTDALSYREKYFIETKSALNAEIAYLVAKENMEYHYQQAVYYLNQAENAYYVYNYNTYISYAEEEAYYYEQEKNLAAQKEQQMQNHQDQAFVSLKKYVDLINAELDLKNFIFKYPEIDGENEVSL